MINGENFSSYKLYNPMIKKVVMSRDVRFDEEKIWHWADEGQQQQLILEDEEEAKSEYGEQNMAASPPPQSLSDKSSSSTPRKTRSIQEIYNIIQRLDLDDFNMLCLFTGSNPLIFEETVQEEKWRIAMKDEMNAISKNDTWELHTLPNGHQAIRV